LRESAVFRPVPVPAEARNRQKMPIGDHRSTGR
jgi:hypothetical protein